MMYFESDSIKDHSNELRLPDQPSPPSAAYHRHLPSPIRPPTPLTPSSSLSTADISSNSSSNNCNYSLFQRDISAPSLDCWNSILRKHSVANDGADFKVSSTFTPVSSMDAAATATASTVGCSTPSVWRRQSTPNTHSSCLLCSHRSCNLQPCGHAICLACLASLPFASMACPVCLQSTLETQILARQEWDQADRMIAGLQPNPQHFLAPAPAYPCAKLTNIPWDVSQNDIRNFFSNCRIPSLSIHAQAIHIMMDRTTGKTLSDAYVEFSSHDELLRAIETRHQKPLKGRIVTVTECPQEELLKVVFPKWRGQFYGISAIPPASEVVKNMSTAAGGGSNACPPFVTREEINSLLVVCKNYKLHFSRKCAERPFENIISIIAKYPWHQVHLISPVHRDHVYEMLKLSIESLKTHLSKDYVQIDPTLLQRLTRAGIMCPAFTDRQKMTLLQTARIDCPTDLLHHFVPSASDYYQLALLNKPSPLSSSARSNEFLFAPPPVPYTDMLYQPASPTHPTSRNNGGGAVTSAAIVSPTIRARVPRSSDCDKRILTV